MILRQPGSVTLNSVETESPESHLKQRLERREARIAVLGLGYVGLPLALALNQRGFPVLGVDPDPIRLQALEQGRSYVEAVESAQLRRVQSDTRWQLQSDLDPTFEAEVFLLCLPTPLGRANTPDLGILRQAAEKIAAQLKPGNLVILESTTWPGTTATVLQPILEQNSGYRAGQDFFLAYSPERSDPGNPNYHLCNTPRIVAGLDPASSALAVQLYQSFCDQVVPVSSLAVAELAKLYENTYRAVNIALVNEMAMLCHKMGLDAWQVLDAAHSKPFGIQAFYPGPGVGGHCIAIDPLYLQWSAQEHGFLAGLMSRAVEINRGMPLYVCGRAKSLLADMDGEPADKEVLLLGVAYKADVADAREAPAVEILQRLRGMGYPVRYHDPLIPKLDLEGESLVSQPLTETNLKRASLVLLLTAHASFDLPEILRHSRFLLDTRGACRHLQPDPERVILL